MNFVLDGDKIRIRPPERGDIKSVVELANNQEVARYTKIPHPYSSRDAAWFIRRCKRERKEGSGFTFAIEFKPESRSIGMIGLSNYSAENRRAVLGYWLGRPYWGRGIASEAVKLALIFAFERFELDRVLAHVWHPNVASARVLEKCGFTLEGRLRKHTLRNGEIYDDLVYGILKEEF